MKTKPKVLRHYLSKLIPRISISEVAKRTGIALEKLERATKEEVDFSYKELLELGKLLDIPYPYLLVEPKEQKPVASRFDFRMLGRTRGEGKVVWWDVLPESAKCGMIYARHRGIQHLKSPMSPVLQCIGMTDRRGVPVYEGDIVELDDKYVGEITWLPEYTGFAFTTLGAHIPISVVNHLIPKGKVIGNRYIAPLKVYHELVGECELEIDERTGLRTVIYTGRPRPDGDDIVLYLERDFDTEEVYLTDLGETGMYIATLGIEKQVEELKVSVGEETVLLNLKGLINEIEEVFKEAVNEG